MSFIAGVICCLARERAIINTLPMSYFAMDFALCNYAESRHTQHALRDDAPTTGLYHFRCFSIISFSFTMQSHCLLILFIIDELRLCHEACSLADDAPLDARCDAHFSQLSPDLMADL